MTISLEKLDTHLFGCADIIRDAVDSTDYKEYILPSVYLESTSDEVEKQCPRGLVGFLDELGQPTGETRDQAVFK
jgi:type I restriction enzyme M protein